MALGACKMGAFLVVEGKLNGRNSKAPPSDRKGNKLSEAMTKGRRKDREKAHLL